MLLERPLCRLESTDHTKACATIRLRRCARQDAVDEVLQLNTQRLDEIDPRDDQLSRADEQLELSKCLER